MKTWTLKTLAAGLCACACGTLIVSGATVSAAEPFYGSAAVSVQDNRAFDQQRNAQFAPSVRPQWIDQDRATQLRTDLRQRPMNADYGTAGEYINERCPNGECRLNPQGRDRADGLSTQRCRQMDDRFNSAGRGYGPRNATLTGWDSGSVQGDFARGARTDVTSRFGRAPQNCNCANGDCRCVNGVCECPDGQCDCRNGQCSNCSLSSRNNSVRYPNYELTRRNDFAPQYRPVGLSYRN